MNELPKGPGRFGVLRLPQLRRKTDLTLADQTEFFTDTITRMAARNAQSLASGAGAPH